MYCGDTIHVCVFVVVVITFEFYLFFPSLCWDDTNGVFHQRVMPLVSEREPEGGAAQAEVPLRPPGAHSPRTAGEASRHQRSPQEMGNHSV